MNTKPLKEESKEVVEQKQGGALEVIDYGADAGVGMENIGADEIKIPFLRIIQNNSPQVMEGEAKYIVGARPKMILNTSTNEIYDGMAGFEMIPCVRSHKYVEYIPRSQNGGGFVGVREPNDPLVVSLRDAQGKFGKLSNGVTRRNEKGEALDGTEIQETFEIYAILIAPDGRKFRAIVPFASTQIPIYQGFVGRADGIEYQGPNGMIRPPMWAHRWRLIVTPQKNKKGSFFGWNVTLATKKEDGSDDLPIKSRLKLTDQLYKDGRAFYDLVKEGKAQADRTADAKSGAAATAGEDEIPM